MQLRHWPWMLGVVLIWGYSFIPISYALQEVPPFTLLLIRFFLLLPCLFWIPRPPVPMRLLVWIALFMNVGQFSFLFLSIYLGMPVGLTALLLQSQAFFTLLIAALWLNERVTLRQWLGLILAFGSVALLGRQTQGNATLLGFAAALLAALSWGLGNIFLKRILRVCPPFPMLHLIIWMGLPSFLLLIPLAGFLEGVQVWQEIPQALSIRGILSILFLAFLSTLGGYALWGKLLAIYPASRVAPFSLLTPVVGMVCAYLFLGERLTALQLLGVVLVMVGLLLNSLEIRR